MLHQLFAANLEGAIKVRDALLRELEQIMPSTTPFRTRIVVFAEYADLVHAHLPGCDIVEVGPETTTMMGDVIRAAHAALYAEDFDEVQIITDDHPHSRVLKGRYLRALSYLRGN